MHFLYRVATRLFRAKKTVVVCGTGEFGVKVVIVKAIKPYDCHLFSKKKKRRSLAALPGEARPGGVVP